MSMKINSFVLARMPESNGQRHGDNNLQGPIAFEGKNDAFDTDGLPNADTTTNVTKDLRDTLTILKYFELLLGTRKLGIS